ncbi:MAG: class I SAM-dependent methyltransferase [Candidatus Marinimicrobia bacterium]|nr:class I SAM-dependent methyltransferase [Candidatus Neomarinimicrobiota bacterium]MBL7009733.1 class I SAM-dependent methyltransferase [Candidatus Neomarinimicrobiota bacterium]MBL7029863.1 class I SAM-dependent methyltransferase [Candidatus Neomarinimicrobiota bacterium]
MSFLSAYFYDSFLAKTEKACLKEWRKDILKHVHGNVLEIGAGTGANILVYPNNGIQLTLSEPDKHMRKQLEDKVVRNGLNHILITSNSIEDNNAKSETYDCVVSTLVSCSVPTLESTFTEIKRILKPNGYFLFIEHVGAEKGTRRRLWQNRFTPIWRNISGNCHLNRDIEDAIVNAGFTLKEIKRESMRKATPLVRPTIRGIAVKN